jgi:glycosyltransferase involved in cell wall biosynthesis
MKVFMLTWEFPPRIVGGVARHCFGLAQALARMGHEIHVITLEFPGAPAYEDLGGVKVYRAAVELGHPNFLTWVLLFNHFMEKLAASLCHKVKPDVIHAHDWLVSPSAISLKHHLNKPLILTVHSTEVGRAQGLHGPDSFTIDGFEWWATYEARKVIVTSEAMKNEVSGHFKLPTDKIEVIPNAVDVERFEIPVDRQWVRGKYVAPHEKMVLFTGRLTPQKGVEYLIHAVPLILKRNPEAKIVIIGEGWLRDSLQTLARSMGCQDKVFFTGFLSERDLAEAMVSADVLTVPSVYEPFGIVALEGMAAGVPVVASKTGGLAEVIEHGETGILVYPRDPESIAWGVSQILSNPNYAQQIVKNAKEKLRKNFSWDAVAEKTIRLYEEVLKG